MTEIRWNGEIVGEVTETGQLVAANPIFQTMWDNFKENGVEAMTQEEFPPTDVDGLNDNVLTDGRITLFGVGNFFNQLREIGYEVTKVI